MAEAALEPQARSCYHCGEKVPDGVVLCVEIAGENRPMCCPGCQAVASMIAGSGLQDFYRNRAAYSTRPEHPEAHPESEYRVFDDDDVAADFCHNLDNGQREAQLLLGGITCAACTWLIEHALQQVPGIEFADVNLQQSRLTLRFQPTEVRLSDICRRLEALGYRPQPFHQDARQNQLREEHHANLRRLGVAGFGMMQVGMFAIALHAGDMQGIEEQYRGLLRSVSLLVSGFVVYYAAGVFFRTAWRHLRHGALVMDLPVALAIALAWLASAWATISSSGEVYFDSVVMFTFFLLLGRFIEARIRQRHAPGWADVEAQLPPSVTVKRNGEWQAIGRSQLRNGDRMMLKPGQFIAADGRVVTGVSAVREESINGEHLPRSVAPGDDVYAGSVNIEGALEVEVFADAAHSRLAALHRATIGGSGAKPQLAKLADRIAGGFVAGILLVTAATALYWWQADPARALWVSLSVLVISCPCALALATPAALAAAVGRLRERGILVCGENALESLPRCTHLLFDKTGTLTEGKLSLREVVATGSVNEAQLLAIGAALQQWSNHPVAHAFHDVEPVATCHLAEQVVGAGIEGRIGERKYRMGSAEFCRSWCPDLPAPPPAPLYWVALCSEGEALGWLGLADKLRPDATTVITHAQSRGLKTLLLSGDSSPQAVTLAHDLQLAIAGTGVSAEEKLATVQQLQEGGATVAMVGDGLNDAPVLSAADISFAVAGAADYTRAQADIILASSLNGLDECWRTAHRCRRIIYQNLGWALAYNLLAIPLAASGHVPPWAAAIGMSLSSLLVVLNALRLYRNGGG